MLSVQCHLRKIAHQNWSPACRRGSADPTSPIGRVILGQRLKALQPRGIDLCVHPNDRLHALSFAFTLVSRRLAPDGMRFHVLFCIYASLSLAVSVSRAQTCGSPRLRQDWCAICIAELSILHRIEGLCRRTLGRTAQLQYTSAVQCLVAKPAKGQAYSKAVKSRFDDFVAAHQRYSGHALSMKTHQRVNNKLRPLGLLTCTGGVHMVGLTFPWHRYAIWLYETALRDECGYSGAQPYALLSFGIWLC